MNISDIKKEECCGCTACMSICPTQSINMIADEQGFLYPQINAEKCIECSLCYNVCETAKNMKNSVLTTYAIKNKNEDILSKSSSGGLSHALCEAIIAKGGVVYGVGYSDDLERALTKRAETLEECEDFFGSKYVQTSLENSFTNLRKDLVAGRAVLFFGSSCHIAGLLSYLQSTKIDLSNLYTVDFACHGVPSPKLFRDYILLLKKNKGFDYFAFRTKEIGWGNGSRGYGCTIFYKDGSKETDSSKARLFLNLFFSNNCLRPRCYDCHFATPYKPADITMADYWGVEKKHPMFYSKEGVSAAICHTDKGRQLIEENRSLNWISTEIEDVLEKQANLKTPSQKGSQYNMFWKTYTEKGFMSVARRWGGYNLLSRLKRRIKQMFR